MLSCSVFVANIKWKFPLFQGTVSHTANPGNSGSIFSTTLPNQEKESMMWEAGVQGGQQEISA